VLDKLAAVVKDAASSAATLLTGPADPGAAANLQPGIGDGIGDSGEQAGGSAAALDQPPAAQAGGQTDGNGSSGGSSSDAAAAGSQEWLAPQPKLADRSPAEAAAQDASANRRDSSAAAAASAGTVQQQQQDAAAPAAANGAGQQQQQQPVQQQQKAQPPSEEELERAVRRLPPKAREAAKTKIRASWAAKDARGGDKDFLYELGQTDYNTNVDVGGWTATSR